jgi:RNA polymerase sigma-70 factor (ECF subfamily)
MRRSATRETATIRDAELVRRALAGSGEAYREIVRRFERPVMSLIVRMVRDPATAEDLAQETFVKAFRNLRRYDPRRKLASWLFKIAHNATLDHLRKKSLDTVPLEPADAAGEGSWEVLSAPAAWAPDRRAESAELLAGLDRALARMRPNYREILLLRFREGLAYRDLAEVMELPMGTVKIQLHRARKQLLHELEKLGLAPAGAEAAKQEPATSRRVATKESPE